MWGTQWALRVLAGAVLIAGLSLAPSAPASAAAVPVLVLDGTGYGHGVGLSQWGAEYLARTGLTTEQILGTFYPGAQLATSGGPMRVSVHKPGVATTTLSFPQGGEVRSALEGAQAEGFPVRVGQGGQVRITFDGAYRVTALVTGQSTSSATLFAQDECLYGLLCPTTTAPPPTTTTTAPPGGPTTTAPPPAPAGATASSSNPVVAVPRSGGVTRVDERGRSYRGAIEATGGGGLRLVNLVGVESYLRGMAEVPSTWPAAAVQAQTIAARTYALRAMQASGEICDDARCQVYVGVSAESPGQDAAVTATTKRVLAYHGALAAAVYSADAGGVSANTFEGFGTPDGTYPYLTNVHYPTDNPLPWHLVVGFDVLGTRLGYPGTVTGAHVSQTGPSGRALEMVLEGSAGDRPVDGHRFARALGLRSTRFVAALGTADGTPLPPPPSEEPIQVLPGDAGAMARQPIVQLGDLRIDRTMPDGPTASAIVSLPPALDPRRHPASLAALLLVALLVGGHVPLVLARSTAPMRPWSRWKPGTRRR